MCGSLVEILSDNTVSFIHLSVNEFLTQDYGELTQSFADSGFYFRNEQAHHCLATVTLSYLTHDVPAQPLGGRSDTTADADFVKSKFSLLSYATQYWPVHLSQVIQGLSIGRKLSLQDYTCIVSLAIAFLASPKRLSLWIEAS